MKKKIAVLGVTGMLGHKMFEVIGKRGDYEVIGTVTNAKKIQQVFPAHYLKCIYPNFYADDEESIKAFFRKFRPDIIINCIGIIKQSSRLDDQMQTIQINAVFPHQLAKIGNEYKTRLITIGTDCVFDGTKKGAYLESDPATCHDVYGMTKYLGEVHYPPHLTLRTSIIGHELFNKLSLLEWFLNEKSPIVKGYKKALFSGLTTLELATIIIKKIIPDNTLQGLFHISSDPINKFNLLKLIAKHYNKKVEIIPDRGIDINRVLCSDKLRARLKYKPPVWDKLIANLYQDYCNSEFYNQ